MSVEPLTIEMLIDQTGAPDSRSHGEYKKGVTYTFSTESSVDLGRVFVREGWAIEITPAPEVEEIPAAKQLAKPENKQLSKPDNKATPSKTPKPASRRRRTSKAKK